MSELSRRRSAREIWISRSHLLAMGVGAVVLAVGAFAAGTLVGGTSEAHASAGVEAIPPGGVPDDSLIELLARVEASADPTGGVGELSFPETLAGESQALAIPEAPASAPLVATVEPGIHDGAPAVSDPTPAGRFTVEVLRTDSDRRASEVRDQLTSRDLPAWVGARAADGALEYRVSVGGFGDEDAAADELAAWRSGTSLPLLNDAQVVPIR